MILAVKIFKRQRRTWPRITQPLLHSDWRTHRTSPKAKLASIHSAFIQIWPVMSRIDIRTPHTLFSGGVLVSPTGGIPSFFLIFFWHWGFWSVPSIICTASLGWFIWSHPLSHIWLWLHIIRSDSCSQWERSVSCQFVVLVVTSFIWLGWCLLEVSCIQLPLLFLWFLIFWVIVWLFGVLFVLKFYWWISASVPEMSCSSHLWGVYIVFRDFVC